MLFFKENAPHVSITAAALLAIRYEKDASIFDVIANIWHPAPDVLAGNLRVELAAHEGIEEKV